MTTPLTVPDHLVPLAGTAFAGTLPLLYEAEEEDLGNTDPHFLTNAILRLELANHLASQPQFRVFADLNFYYGPGNPPPSATPDIMVVIPGRDLGVDVSSYHLGADGPAPVLVVEILSERTAQQRDLGDKIRLYAQLGVTEYILVDQWRRWLPQRLLLKRLQSNGRYRDVLDPDGGVSSGLGFRLLFEDDGWLNVFDQKTGHRYTRPTQAEQEAKGHRLEAEARRLAEEKQRKAEEKQRKAEEKQRKAEEKQRQAEEKQRLAEEKQRQEAKARRSAEKKQRQAEEKQRQEAEARQSVEEKIQELLTEVERLRQAAEKQPPPNAK